MSYAELIDFEPYKFWFLYDGTFAGVVIDPSVFNWKDPYYQVALIRAAQHYELWKEDVETDLEEQWEAYERERLERRKSKKKEETPKGKPGYVYLLREINGPHYKIGLTQNPQQRLKALSNTLPYLVEFDVLIRTPHTLELERELHEKFADKRTTGEWFLLESEDVEYIRSLATEAENALG